MIGVVFLTLFAFAGKALFQKLLETRRLNKKFTFNQSQCRYKVKSVTPAFQFDTPRGSVSEPDVLQGAAGSSNDFGKHVTFESAATRGKAGSVKTIILGNHQQGII